MCSCWYSLSFSLQRRYYIRSICIHLREIMIRVWTILICLVGVNTLIINSSIITGETNHKQVLRWQFIMSDIRGCSLNGQAMNMLLKMHDMFLCMSHKTSHCRMKQVRRFVKDKYEVGYTYCGAFSYTGRTNSQNIQVMYIQTYINYILNLEFNHFIF